VHFGTGLAAALFATQLQASEIVYQPVNPSFGGNPFNSGHLLGVANSINDYKDPNALNNSDPAKQFLRTIQSRLLSTIASQVTELIFGDNPQESGVIRFGDQEIRFVRGLDSVTLTITNFTDGSVTEIVVPLLQTDGEL
jgi:curli production assembly/transport component CsgF